MARKSNTVDTPAVLETEEEVETTTAEPTTKQVIGEGIARVIESTGIDVQKNRYKAMRAIAFQAFSEAIEAGDFDALVDRALENIDSLPAGWEIERPAHEEPAPVAKKSTAKASTSKATPAPAPAKASTAKAATKATTKTAAKGSTATARKRPTR